MKKAAIVIAVVLVGMVLLWVFGGPDESMPTEIPAASIAAAETAQGPPAPIPTPLREEAVSVQIARAMGGFVVACGEVPGHVRGISPVLLPGGRHWLVPTSEGSRPTHRAEKDESSEFGWAIRPGGVFHWEGASDSTVGRCATTHAELVPISGHVDLPSASLAICGNLLQVDEDGAFQGEIPPDIDCEVEVWGHIPTPHTVSGSGPFDIRVEPDPRGAPRLRAAHPRADEVGGGWTGAGGTWSI